jgi:Protein of unknown function (DUF5656)
VDNRTGIRPPSETQEARDRGRGHAFYAAQARRALGVQLHSPLGELRTPIFHFVIGVLVAGIAVMARPDRVGVWLGIGLDVVLALLGVAALMTYDRLFCPPEARPGLEGGALPTAALLGEAVVLAGTSAAGLWVPAVVLAAVVIAAAPHLSSRRLAGHDEAWLRLARDAAGVAVMVPAVILGLSSAPGPVRGFVVWAAAALTTVDAVHTEQGGRRRGLVASFLVGAVVAGCLVPATRGAQVTAAGGLLLVLWYGLRGLAVASTGSRLSRVAVAEYGVFVAAAGTLLGMSARH